MELAALTAYRDVFALREATGIQPKSCFVVSPRPVIVIDDPSCSAGTARSVNEPTVAVHRARSDARDTDPAVSASCEDRDAQRDRAVRSSRTRELNYPR